MVQKSVEKLTKYRDLQIEVDKMWQTSNIIQDCSRHTWLYSI